jgi:hypothetical protein
MRQRRFALACRSATPEHKKTKQQGVMFLAENLKTLLNASIAFVRTNALRAKPKPLYKQKEQTRKGEKTLCVCSFSVCLMKSWLHHDEIFALLR